MAVLALGPCACRAAEAAEKCLDETGLEPSVYDMRFLKPLDTSILEEVSSCKAILTVEDGALKGGLFGAVSEYFAGRPGSPVIKGAGIPDRFIANAPQGVQREECGIDTESILDLLLQMIKS